MDQGKLKQVLNDEKIAYRQAQLDKSRSVEREAADWKTNTDPNTQGL